MAAESRPWRTKLMKVLKALMWHLSREPIKGIDNLKTEPKNIRRTNLDEQAKRRTSSRMDRFRDEPFRRQLVCIIAPEKCYLSYRYCIVGRGEVAQYKQFSPISTVLSTRL